MWAMWAVGTRLVFLIKEAVKVMAFAKEYREEITLAYYCFNSALTIALFVFGTVYFKHRDRRDQQRKEWRDFAETIRKEHNELKRKNIPRKISMVKNTFQNIQICKDINGIDVLRFMMRDPNYESSMRTEELDDLQEDLDSVYQLLNRCASLILLGTVPENIRAELGKLVTGLVELTLPFYRGEERKTILKCLMHFGYFSREEKDEETRKGNLDRRLKEDIPYLRFFRFSSRSQFLHKLRTKYRMPPPSYEDTRKFTYEFPTLLRNPVVRDLAYIYYDLEQERYVSYCANELRVGEHASNLNFIDKIDSGDADELLVAKLLHEVRYMIHCIEKGTLPEEGNGLNVETLRDIHERVTKLRPNEVIVRGLCEQLMQDLQSYVMESTQEYHKSERFRLQFEELCARFQEIMVIWMNGGPRAPPLNATVLNHQYETSL